MTQLPANRQTRQTDDDRYEQTDRDRNYSALSSITNMDWEILDMAC